jgi:hypothetical protein
LGIGNKTTDKKKLGKGITNLERCHRTGEVSWSSGFKIVHNRGINGV